MNPILAFLSTNSKETVSVIVPLAVFGLNFFIQGDYGPEFSERTAL